MEHLDPVLVSLRAELERLGYVVVSHGDHLCVRLPLLASVRVRVIEGHFRFVPQFGPFGRTGGLLFTSGAAAAAVGGAAFAVGAAPLTLLVGFLGVVALAHDACRFVLTEGFLTRLQQIVAPPGTLQLGGAPGGAAQLGAGQPEASAVASAAGRSRGSRSL